MSPRKNRDEDVVKPQVIDLEAENVSEIAEDSPHVKDADPAPSEQPASSPLSTSRKQLPYAWAAMVLAIGAVLGGWAYRNYLLQYFPPDQFNAATTRIAAIESAQQEQATRLTSLGQMDEQLHAGLSEVETRIGKLATGAAADSPGLSDLQKRIAALETAAAELSQNLASVKATFVPAAPASPAQTDPAAITNLQGRLSTVEREVSALKQAASQPAPVNPLFTSFAALRRKIESGGPYAAELVAVTAALTVAPPTPQLQQFATTGLPSSSALASELQKIATSPTSGNPPAESEDTYFAMIKRSVSGLITFKRVGAADWRTVATDAAASADTGDIPEAVTQLEESLKGHVPPELAPWLAKARAKVAAEAELDRLSASVIDSAQVKAQ